MRLLLVLVAASTLAIAHGQNAPTDKKGRIILYTIKAGAFGVPVPLEDNYGILLVNDGDEKQPKPRFILGCRKRKSLLDTHDIRQFKAALSTIPMGSTVYQYDSCTVSRSWGLRGKTFDQFNATLSSRRLRVLKDRRTTCYCESMG